MNRMERWSVAVIAVLSGCFSGLGCESSPSNGTLQRANKEYQSGNFADAESTAAKAMSNSEGDAKHQAAYVAGMSAYQQGKLREAEGSLLVAAESTVPDTAGRAKAMLGMIRMKQERASEAAMHFSAAASLLKGEDATNAAALAAAAYQKAGNESAARTWSARAAGRSAPSSGSSSSTAWSSHVTRDPGASSRPNASAPPMAAPLGKGYTLQVGAFKDRQHAQRAAADAQGVSQDNGLGGVRIVASDDSFGQTLHLVQVGSFETRAAASAARQRIGRLQYIVTPATGNTAAN